MSKITKKTKAPKRAKIAIKPVTPFKLKKSITYELNYGEFEDMVEEVYKDDAEGYSFLAEEESANDVSHKFVIKKDKLDGRPFRNGAAFNGADNILTDMCNRGFIPAGTYVIDVCW